MNAEKVDAQGSDGPKGWVCSTCGLVYAKGSWMPCWRCGMDPPAAPGDRGEA